MPGLPFDWSQVIGVLAVFFGAAFFYLQFRHRPKATKEVKTATDLRARIRGNQYTLVQLFAPL
jgi:protein-S-isoprenylcysteine O-methyltransferase Ste14